MGTTRTKQSKALTLKYERAAASVATASKHYAPASDNLTRRHLCHRCGTRVLPCYECLLCGGTYCDFDIEDHLETIHK